MKRLSDEDVNDIAKKYLKLQDKIKYKDKCNNTWIMRDTATDEDIRKFKTYQNYCMEKFSYIIKSKAAKYRKFSNHPDLEQDGFEALIKSFNSFDPEKGNFSWWASQYVQIKLSRSANAHSTIRFPIKKAKIMKPYKTTIPVMIDESADPFEYVTINQSNELINNAINNLPKIHKDIINMKYGFNGVMPRTENKILNDLKLTRTEFLKLLKEAKEKIRQQILILK